MANYIHPTALIGPNVKLGDNNYIGPYCIIGYPAEHKGFWEMENTVPEAFRHFPMIKEVMQPKAGSLIIGDNNVFTGHCTVDAGTEKDTIIFNNCWFLKGAHVGHDAIIHDNVIISCHACVGGHAIIHANCNLGLNSSVHQRIHLPEKCIVGMNSCITKKTPLLPNRKYAGVPARDLGENFK